MKLSEIAELVDGELHGNGQTEITGVGKIENAEKHQITFISNPLYEKYFENTNAGCVLVNRDFRHKKRAGISVIEVDDPYISFIKLLEMFEETIDDAEGISETCIIGEDCVVEDGVYIGDFVSIGKNCTIGKGARIMSNCTVESNVAIGAFTILYPNVSIYRDTVIGSKVIVHSGTVIGCDGFGFAKNPDGTFKKIPQTGNVIIEDNVEIGANTCIDRATIDSTIIRRGVKIDNQVQIAHNVEIGEDTVIAAQAGIAGSTKIGKRCMIGGQAGIVGHLTICDDVLIGASVGVSKSITSPGLYTGYRAKPQREDLKSEVRIRNLESLEKRIREIESKIQNS